MGVSSCLTHAQRPARSCSTAAPTREEELRDGTARKLMQARGLKVRLTGWGGQESAAARAHPGLNALDLIPSRSRGSFTVRADDPVSVRIASGPCQVLIIV